MKNSIYIAKGTGIALIISVACLIIFSLILTYTNISETMIEPITIAITGVSILLGSFVGNMKIRKNGLLNGGLIGIAYLLILYLVSSLLNWSFGLDIQSIIMIAIGIVFGILGGVLGVNKRIKT